MLELTQPGAIDVRRGASNEFIPFLDYPVELRKIVYTNAIESINSPLRKISKPRVSRQGTERDRVSMASLRIRLETANHKRLAKRGLFLEYGCVL